MDEPASKNVYHRPCMIPSHGRKPAELSTPKCKSDWSEAMAGSQRPSNKPSIKNLNPDPQLSECLALLSLGRNAGELIISNWRSDYFLSFAPAL